MVSVVLGLLAAVFPALFAWSARPGTAIVAPAAIPGGVVDAPLPIRRPKPANRASLVVAFAESVLILVLAHRLVDWVLINPLLWLLPVALLSFGVALTVHSWHELPRWKEGRPVGRSMLWLGIQLALILAVLILVLVL